MFSAKDLSFVCHNNGRLKKVTNISKWILKFSSWFKHCLSGLWCTGVYGTSQSPSSWRSWKSRDKVYVVLSLEHWTVVPLNVYLFSNIPCIVSPVFVHKLSRPPCAPSVIFEVDFVSGTHFRSLYFRHFLSIVMKLPLSLLNVNYTSCERIWKATLYFISHEKFQGQDLITFELCRNEFLIGKAISLEKTTIRRKIVFL